MANPADTATRLSDRVEQIQEAARNQALTLATHRHALRGLLEGVETARQSFPRGSREERIFTGAIAGWDDAARTVLGE